MKWYVIQANWDQDNFVGGTLTQDEDVASRILENLKFKIAIKTVAKLGIQKNIDLTFYKDQANLQIINLSQETIDKLSVEEFTKLMYNGPGQNK